MHRTQNPQEASRRIGAFLIALITVASGLAVHLWVADSVASDIAGDALYVVVIYAGIVVLSPRTAAPWVALWTAAWCVSIELFQLTDLPLTIGAAFPPAMLVLGTVFDVRDVVIYLCTCGVLVLADLWGARRALRR